MICPDCKTDDPGVYVGFSTVECVNNECTHFSVKTLAAAMRSALPTKYPGFTPRKFSDFIMPTGRFDDANWYTPTAPVKVHYLKNRDDGKQFTLSQRWADYYVKFRR